MGDLTKFFGIQPDQYDNMTDLELIKWYEQAVRIAKEQAPKEK